MHLMGCQRVYQVIHARDGVWRVFTVRETRRQILERIERFARGFGIPFGKVLAAHVAQPAQVPVEVGQALEIVSVIDVGMVRLELDETLRSGNGLSGLVVLIVRIGDLELRLLRVTAVGITRLEFLVVLDRFLVVAVVQIVLGLGIKLLRGPAFGLIVVWRQQTARRNERADEYRYTITHYEHRPASEKSGKLYRNREG